MNNCGPKICDIDDERFTYIRENDLIPILSLYYYKKYLEIGDAALLPLEESGEKVYMNEEHKYMIEHAKFYVTDFINFRSKD